jgi:hypothetical protein
MISVPSSSGSFFNPCFRFEIDQAMGKDTGDDDVLRAGFTLPHKAALITRKMRHLWPVFVLEAIPWSI